jgi:hypothetical protein
MGGAPALTGPLPSQPLPDGVGPGPIRRLSREEIGNAIESLLGLRPAALVQIPGDKQDHAFDRVAQAQTVTAAHLEAISAIADELAGALTAEKLAALAPACAGATGSDGAELGRARRPCIEQFIDGVGKRAFRRPVDPAKRGALLALYDAGGSWGEGLRLVLQGMFAAPEFLYVIELGRPVAGKPGLFALTDLEIATRLSLLACESIPDAPLLQAAEAGQLNQPAQIAAQARRLFALPCARRAVARFFRQWLNVERVEGLVRDPAAYPMWNPALGQSMLREQEAFVQHVTFDAGGSLPDLFTAGYSFVDRTLAPLYGLDAGKLGDAPARTELPAHRRGLLTQPAVLAVTSHAKDTSPVLRGVYVLRRLLCKDIPAPPQNLDLKAPPADPAQTGRNRWQRHSADPACAGCHAQIDPVGFAMEDFDGIGRHRSQDNGLAVDTAGPIPALQAAAGEIDGGAGLAMALADSPELAGCFARQWFRFGMGRLEGPADGRALQDLTAQLTAHQPLLQVMTALVQSHPFRHRTATP